MAWYNPFTWPSYNGSNDNSIPAEYGSINGVPTRFSLDTYGIGVTKHTHFPNSYSRYVELQREVFVVNNAVGKIAKILSKANFTADKDNDRLLAKLKEPNKKQSQQEFLKEFATFIKSAGWVVIWKRNESFANWETLELIPLDPDKVSFTEKNDAVIGEYEGQSYTISLQDCIIFYDSVRDKNGKGYSVLKPLRSQICNVLDAQKAKGIQIENSGTTIVSPKTNTTTGGIVDEGLDSVVIPDLPAIPGSTTPSAVKQKQIIEDKLNHRGLDNRIVVSSKGLDVVNLSSEFNNFKFDEAVEKDVLAIFDAFGIPVELTPYGKNNTYDNMQRAELAFVQSEILPLAQSLVDSLNAEFPNRGFVYVDFNDLDCMSIVEKRKEETNSVRIKQVTDMITAGLIDVPKGKEMLNDIING